MNESCGEGIRLRRGWGERQEYLRLRRGLFIHYRLDGSETQGEGCFKATSPTQKRSLILGQEPMSLSLSGGWRVYGLKTPVVHTSSFTHTPHTLFPAFKRLHATTGANIPQAKHGSNTNKVVGDGKRKARITGKERYHLKRDGCLPPSPLPPIPVGSVWVMVCVQVLLVLIIYPPSSTCAACDRDDDDISRRVRNTGSGRGVRIYKEKGEEGKDKERWSSWEVPQGQDKKRGPRQSLSPPA
ncbi:unnamed protein product [Pleuronectes platessa]|uniref:Uncharacterized protein n=1 Tax=Pleuronectes platessa TaxID=8262 RepID=A0A9N7UPF3_PLEPL|nr:unnamed protein product [Pleuronectes platessa]